MSYGGHPRTPAAPASGQALAPLAPCVDWGSAPDPPLRACYCTGSPCPRSAMPLMRPWPSSPCSRLLPFSLRRAHPRASSLWVPPKPNGRQTPFSHGTAQAQLARLSAFAPVPLGTFPPSAHSAPLATCISFPPKSRRDTLVPGLCRAYCPPRSAQIGLSRPPIPVPDIYRAYRPPRLWRNLRRLPPRHPIRKNAFPVDRCYRLLYAISAGKVRRFGRTIPTSPLCSHS